MAARSLPPPLLADEGRAWAALLHRAAGGAEWAVQLEFSWARPNRDRAHGLVPPGRPRAPYPWTAADFQAGTFVPWFAFEGLGHQGALVLDLELGYHLSRGAEVTLWLPLPLRDSASTRRTRLRLPGHLQHATSTPPAGDPLDAFRPLAIWGGGRCLAGSHVAEAPVASQVLGGPGTGRLPMLPHVSDISSIRGHHGSLFRRRPSLRILRPVIVCLSRGPQRTSRAPCGRNSFRGPRARPGRSAAPPPASSAGSASPVPRRGQRLEQREPIWWHRRRRLAARKLRLRHPAPEAAAAPRRSC